MWFEHWINYFVSTLATRKGIDKDDITQMIREVNIKGKYTWLLSILGFRKIK